MNKASSSLKLVHLGIDTQKEFVVYMLRDCLVCVSEGFDALSRVQVSVNGKTIVASLNIINGTLLNEGEVGLSERAWEVLGASAGDILFFSHPQTVSSLRSIRSKIYGNKLDESSYFQIIEDLVDGKFSNIEIAAFITACSGDRLSVDEMISLTKAMIHSGDQLKWAKDIIVDKHCVGGLPGNRTTPIVVSIVAAAGLIIPKTSSRAITSPAGTADVMETMTNVSLGTAEIKKIVDQENGCFVWGGSVMLSPADDILIKIEKALDLDSEGQMVASVLSKKAAAGSSHVIIDIPIGKTAKVRTEEDAEKLKYYFNVVSKAIGIKVKIITTDGSQPVGRGIGPALEAMDVLKVLRNEKDAPQDLKKRALYLAEQVLIFSGHSKSYEGNKMAEEILSSGKALDKFMAICKAQGGFKEPKLAEYLFQVRAESSGSVVEIDNRRIAKVAKLAGAPKHSSAGVLLSVGLNALIKKNDILYTIYSEHQGELNYVLDYVNSEANIITIQ